MASLVEQHDRDSRHCCGCCCCCCCGGRDLLLLGSGSNTKCNVLACVAFFASLCLDHFSSFLHHCDSFFFPYRALPARTLGWLPSPSCTSCQMWSVVQSRTHHALCHHRTSCLASTRGSLLAVNSSFSPCSSWACHFALMPLLRAFTLHLAPPGPHSFSLLLSSAVLMSTALLFSRSFLSFALLSRHALGFIALELNPQLAFLSHLPEPLASTLCDVLLSHLLFSSAFLRNFKLLPSCASCVSPLFLVGASCALSQLSRTQQCSNSSIFLSASFFSSASIQLSIVLSCS